MNVQEMQDVVEKLKFQDWNFNLIFPVGDPPYLQVSFFTDDNWEKGAEKLVNGRKWQLSYHMTKSEVIQTALKAVLTAMEHEVREQFLYNGRAIFGPHYDVDALWQITDKVDVRE